MEQLLVLGADKLILQWTAETPEGKIRSVFYDTALPEDFFAEDAERHPQML